MQRGAKKGFGHLTMLLEGLISRETKEARWFETEEGKAGLGAIPPFPDGRGTAWESLIT